MWLSSDACKIWVCTDGGCTEARMVQWWLQAGEKGVRKTMENNGTRQSAMRKGGVLQLKKKLRLQLQHSEKSTASRTLLKFQCGSKSVDQDLFKKSSTLPTSVQ